MTRFSRFGMAIVAVCILLAATGCIRSRVRITSEPPGATVRFQKVERGETPVTIPFIWYWYYDIDVEKAGFEPVHARERFRTPPWFLFPLDFVAELMPFPIPDTRHRHYALTPIAQQP